MKAAGSRRRAVAEVGWADSGSVPRETSIVVPWSVSCLAIRLRTAFPL